MTWFDDDTPAALIELIQPQILVEGGDWAPEAIVGSAETLARGGQVHSIPVLFDIHDSHTRQNSPSGTCRVKALDMAVLRTRDGRFHSGEQMAQQLGCSRASIWQAVENLSQEYGARIFRVRGKGYRLPAPLVWLDPQAIRC